MRYSTILLLFLITVSSCLQNPKQGSNNKILIPHSDSDKLSHIKSEQEIDSAQSITITDSSKYSLSFIESLNTDTYYRKILLNKDQIIINSEDTAYFPEVPPLWRELHFSNKKNNTKIDLSVKRTLLSTIEYKIDLTDNNKHTFKSGIANLSPRFFVGPEVDEDDSTKYAYYSVEYWDPSEHYQTAIRIGIHKELGNLYLAKIKCFLDTKWYDLYNFPTLFENK